MKQQIKFNRIVIVFAALVMMVFAVASVSADSTDTSYLPTINDGRVNEYDIAAPVAIYDLYDYPFADNVNMGVLDRVEFWGTNGQKVLEVSRAQIVSAVPTSGSSVLVASGSGLSLYKEVDGSLTLIDGSYLYNWTPSL